MIALVRPVTNIALRGEASQSGDFYSKHGKADTAINSVVFPLLSSLDKFKDEYEALIKR